MRKTSAATSGSVAESRPSRLILIGSVCRLLVAIILCVPAYPKADSIPQFKAPVKKQQPSEGRGLVHSDGHTPWGDREAARTVAADQSAALIGDSVPLLEFLDDSARLPVDPQTGLPSRPPLPGENLGYSKQQSLSRLNAQVVRFLGAIKTLYTEPKALADRRRTLEILDVHTTRRWDGSRASIELGPATFSDVFVDGIFSRKGWAGYYTYKGWELPLASKWSVALQTEIDPGLECVDSKAVEGFLELPLAPILGGRVIPIGPDEWDRHGKVGSALANALGNLTPAVRLGFVEGCLVSVVVGATFFLNEISDEKSRN